MLSRSGMGFGTRPPRGWYASSARTAVAVAVDCAQSPMVERDGVWMSRAQASMLDVTAS